MNTTPINQDSCTADNGFITDIFITPIGNITSFPEPIIDELKHRVGPIEHTLPLTRLAPMDTEAEYAVSSEPTPHGDLKKIDVSLMLAKNSEAFSAAMRSLENQDLVLIGMMNDSVIIVIGSPERPLRLNRDLSGNKRMADTPGAEITLSCVSYYKPLYYSGTASHPSGNADLLELS